MIVTFKGTRGSGMTLVAVEMVLEEVRRTGKPSVAYYRPGMYRYLSQEEFVRGIERSLRKEE